ncbi:hypothetical protein HBB16_06930 [Pseudonocardia sp. MCCB 268]|nr:hypothetical protein [Pseudonocardia cytotoxica]
MVAIGERRAWRRDGAPRSGAQRVRPAAVHPGLRRHRQAWRADVSETPVNSDARCTELPGSPTTVRGMQNVDRPEPLEVQDYWATPFPATVGTRRLRPRRPRDGSGEGDSTPCGTTTGTRPAGRGPAWSPTPPRSRWADDDGRVAGATGTTAVLPWHRPRRAAVPPQPVGGTPE